MNFLYNLKMWLILRLNFSMYVVSNKFLFSWSCYVVLLPRDHQAGTNIPCIHRKKNIRTPYTLETYCQKSVHESKQNRVLILHINTEKDLRKKGRKSTPPHRTKVLFSCENTNSVFPLQWAGHISRNGVSSSPLAMPANTWPLVTPGHKQRRRRSPHELAPDTA